MKKFFIATIFFIFLSSSVYASEQDVQNLINYYIKRFSPEKAVMMASGMPDQTGYFNDVYLDLQGVLIEGLRLDSLRVRMLGVQFNSPSEWAEGNVKFDKAMQIYGYGHILETDINNALKSKTFGKEDVWHDMSIKINKKGLHGRGYYLAKTFLVNLDILIEISTGMKIVGMKKLYFDKPAIKINRMDLPDAITNKALADIQPLLDLNEYPDLPVKLHKIIFSEGEVTLTTKNPPEIIKNGITYKYEK